MLILLLILLLVFGGGGLYTYGGPYGPHLGGGVGLIVLIIIVLWLTGNLRG